MDGDVEFLSFQNPLKMTDDFAEKNRENAGPTSRSEGLIAEVGRIFGDLAVGRQASYSPERCVADMQSEVRQILEVEMALNDGSFDLADRRKVTCKIEAGRDDGFRGCRGDYTCFTRMGVSVTLRVAEPLGI